MEWIDGRTGEADGLHVYTSEVVTGTLIQHRYAETLPRVVEPITTGMSIAGFWKGEETLLCLGNSLEGRWVELGALAGGELQRLTTRLEPRGYTLGRFREGG